MKLHGVFRHHHIDVFRLHFRAAGYIVRLVAVVVFRQGLAVDVPLGGGGNFFRGGNGGFLRRGYRGRLGGGNGCFFRLLGLSFGHSLFGGRGFFCSGFLGDGFRCGGLCDNFRDLGDLGGSGLFRNFRHFGGSGFFGGFRVGVCEARGGNGGDTIQPGGHGSGFGIVAGEDDKEVEGIKVQGTDAFFTVNVVEYLAVCTQQPQTVAGFAAEVAIGKHGALRMVHMKRHVARIVVGDFANGIFGPDVEGCVAVFIQEGGIIHIKLGTADLGGVDGIAVLIEGQVAHHMFRSGEIHQVLRFVGEADGNDLPGALAGVEKARVEGPEDDLSLVPVVQKAQGGGGAHALAAAVGEGHGHVGDGGAAFGNGIVEVKAGFRRGENRLGGCFIPGLRGDQMHVLARHGEGVDTGTFQMGHVGAFQHRAVLRLQNVAVAVHFKEVIGPGEGAVLVLPHLLGDAAQDGAGVVQGHLLGQHLAVDLQLVLTHLLHGPIVQIRFSQRDDARGTAHGAQQGGGAKQNRDELKDDVVSHFFSSSIL